MNHSSIPKEFMPNFNKLIKNASPHLNLFDKQLIERYFALLSILSVFMTLLFIFIDIPTNSKINVGILFVISLIVIYFCMWKRYNNLGNVKFEINGTTIEILFGNLFQETGLKVIPFNEYFDTTVDEVIISKNSLHGRFITDCVKSIAEFDEIIDSDEKLAKSMLVPNLSRKYGKIKKYQLGSVLKYNDFILTALSKFDEENRAYLTLQDYVNFLLDFWNEIDIIYAGNNVIIPLFGAGLTRFRKYEDIPEQVLLELIIWSIKTSKIRFKSPAKIKIVLSEKIRDKISLFKFRNYS